MILEIDGRELPIAKSSPDRLTLVVPTELAPGTGRLRLLVDGFLQYRDVLLPSGSDGKTPFVTIASPHAVAVNA